MSDLIDRYVDNIVDVIYDRSVEVVHNVDFFFKPSAISVEPSFDLFMINGSFYFLHNHSLQSKLLHSLFESDDLCVCLHDDETTKLNMSSSSEHLLLPIPKFFQQLVRALKY